MKRGFRGRRLLFALLFLALAGILTWEVLTLLGMPDSPALGMDFIGKWSSSRLLMQGKNPWDLNDLFVLAKSQGWSAPKPVIPRSPPSLHVLLIPFALIPFNVSATLWFVVNVFSLVLSSKLLADLFIPQQEGKSLVWPFCLTFTFSRSLHALFTGQVNTLVLLGIVGSMWLLARNRTFEAGSMLVLTTLKPHLVYLALPLLLLHAVLRRSWSVIVGFLVASLGLTVIAIGLSPRWPLYYAALITKEATATSYPLQVATLRGVLNAYHGLDIGKYLWLAILTGFSLIYIRSVRRGERPSLAPWLGLACWIALPTVPFGWSTDQVLLLIPIFQIVGWTMRNHIVNKKVVALLLALTYSYAFFFWVRSYEEIAFLLLPFAIEALHLYLLRIANQTEISTHQEALTDL